MKLRTTKVSFNIKLAASVANGQAGTCTFILEGFNL